MRNGPGREDILTLTLQALQFAAWKHRYQPRKGANESAYINHPIALANVLHAEAGIDDGVVLAAALLHDTIEDTETTWQELRGEFGDEIANVVLELTDTKWVKKDTRKRLQVQKAAKASSRAKLVKLADKICNLRDLLADPPPEWPLERRQKYFEWAKEVVDHLRGTNETLERKFDEVYARAPVR